MAYEKTYWESREGTHLNRFEKEQDTPKSVILQNSPGSVTRRGTQFTVNNMNKIEEGIFTAHEMISAANTKIEAEAKTRAAADQALSQAVTAESAARQEADQSLSQAIATEAEQRKAADDALQTEILNTIFPVGEVVVQYPNTMSPKEKGLSGDWRICNDKAYRYLLRQEVPVNYTVYTQGANYAVGAWVMYHLPGDDWNFFQARAAITNAPAQLNPVSWTEMRDGSIVDQRFLHGYTDDDFKIGTKVPDGEYAGYYVAAIYVYGGKYAGVAGGNRPTFGSATAGDRIRNISGSSGSFPQYDPIYRDGSLLTGYADYVGSLYGTTSLQMGLKTIRDGTVGLNASRQVPTGNDNAGRTFPILLWQKVAA